MLKKVLPAAIAAALLAGATATTVQAGDIEANVALTTDYRFRGISQSDESAAIQGGFDYSWDNGIYVGTWGSSVDFGGGSFGSLELDAYIGWAGDITENSSIDVGYLYYGYPGDSGSGGATKGDYQEIYGSYSWRDLTIGVHYSDDYYLETDTFFYYYGQYSFAFGDGWGLDFHVGFNDLTDDGCFLQCDDSGTAEDSYVDYSVTLNKSLLGVDLSLAYVGTDIDEDDAWGTDLADDTVVFTIGKSF